MAETNNVATRNEIAVAIANQMERIDDLRTSIADLERQHEMAVDTAAQLAQRIGIGESLHTIRAFVAGMGIGRDLAR